MGVWNKQIEKLLATDIFQSIVAYDTIKIAQLNTLTTFLITSNIPFTSTFSAGTPSSFPKLAIAININPSTQITFTFYFEDI